MLTSSREEGDEKYGVAPKLISTTLTIVLQERAARSSKSFRNATGQAIWLLNSGLRISASITMYICWRPGKTDERSPNHSISVEAL